MANVDEMEDSQQDLFGDDIDDSEAVIQEMNGADTAEEEESKQSEVDNETAKQLLEEEDPNKSKGNYESAQESSEELQGSFHTNICISSQKTE